MKGYHYDRVVVANAIGSFQNAKLNLENAQRALKQLGLVGTVVNESIDNMIANCKNMCEALSKDTGVTREPNT